jgi:hypothetical protein
LRTKKSYTGINIQYPISRLILDGSKTVETRTYRLPLKYVGTPLLIIETPGKAATFTARIVAVVTFGESIQYTTARAFYADKKRHRVEPGSVWQWKAKKPKWGWPIVSIQTLKSPKPAPAKKGIVYTKNVIL